MKRRDFIKLTAFGVVTASVSTVPLHGEQTTQKSKPNIVIFISDDMGWSDVGYHGSTIETPNIDSLAAEGIQLDRFYVFPVCSPTRTALMTGRSPIRFGILRPLSVNSDGPPMDERFLSEAFQDAGYQTVMAGKWHLGGAPGYKPRDRGFEHFYGFLGGFIDYYKHTEAKTGQVDWQRNGKTLNEEGYSTDLIGREAVWLIKNRDRNKPLFLYVPFNAPHAPSQAPEAVIKKYDNAGLRGSRQIRAAMIDAMDQTIGKVLAALDEEGMKNDTIAMFFCDNGGGGGKRPPAGETARRKRPTERNMGNFPFSGGKSSVLEGGIRVPAVLRWPAAIKPGTKTSQVVTVLDLLPTLTAAAGLEPGNTKPLDGENMWPAIRDGKVVPRKPIVIGLGDLAVLDGPWKLIQSGQESRLYNLEEDPTEKQDLAAEHPELVEKLKAAQAPFAALIESRPAPGRRPQGGRLDSRKRRP